MCDMKCKKNRYPLKPKRFYRDDKNYQKTYYETVTKKKRQEKSKALASMRCKKNIYPKKPVKQPYTEKKKQWAKEYRQTEKYKAWRREYTKTEKYKAYQSRYWQSEKYKAWRKEYKERRAANNA